jgi:hypothetical protein
LFVRVTLSVFSLLVKFPPPLSLFLSLDMATLVTLAGQAAAAAIVAAEVILANVLS